MNDRLTNKIERISQSVIRTSEILYIESLSKKIPNWSHPDAKNIINNLEKYSEDTDMYEGAMRVFVEIGDTSLQMIVWCSLMDDLYDELYFNKDETEYIVASNFHWTIEELIIGDSWFPEGRNYNGEGIGEQFCDSDFSHKLSEVVDFTNINIKFGDGVALHYEDNKFTGYST